MDTPDVIEPSSLELAQNRLSAAALAVPMSPASAGISAYVNGTMQAARLDALVDLWITPPNASWSRPEAYDRALIKAVNERAQMLEDRAEEVKRQIAEQERRIQLASAEDVSTVASGVRQGLRTN